MAAKISIANKHSLKVGLNIVLVSILLALYLVCIFIAQKRISYAVATERISKITTVGSMFASSISQIYYDGSSNKTSLQNILTAADNIPTVTYAAIYSNEYKLLALWEDEVLSTFDPTLKLNNSTNIISLKDSAHVITPIFDKNGEQAFLLVMGHHYADSLQKLHQQNLVITLVFLCLFILTFMLFQALISRMIITPIIKLTRNVETIVETGNIGIVLDDYGNNEIGQLAIAFSGLIDNLRSIILNLKELLLQLSVIVDDVSIAGRKVNEGAINTQRQTDITTAAMQKILVSFYEISDNISDVDKSGERGASTIYEMTKVNDQVVQNIHNMNTAIASSNAIVKRTAISITSIADNIKQLNDTINFISSSINTLTNTIGTIEQTTQETAQISEQVTSNAAAGVEAIKKTTEGIEKIKATSELAATTIEHLGNKIDDIGSIIHVIEDITKQTNLLALNAAIIAAQSGENGKSFGVVSEEIAALANRTKSSTREIAELISTIQLESQRAIIAMHNDMGSIEEGVKLGEEAEAILHTIQNSADRSTSMVQHIATTTVDQANDIREINHSIANLALTAKQINATTTVQAEDSQVVLHNISDINNLCMHVLNSSSEQAAATKDLLTVINNISHSLSDLNSSQKGQGKEMEGSLKSLENIRNIAMAQTDSTSQLEKSILSIKAQSVMLNDQIRRFKL